MVNIDKPTNLKETESFYKPFLLERAEKGEINEQKPL